jgi:ArsR family transcriptional regulator
MIQADRMFRAFADETRLRILHLLSRGELCVCDLMSALRLPQSKVSRHLAYLRNAGLVADRRDGRWKHYALAPCRSALQKSIIACVGGCLGEVPALKQDLKRLRPRKTKCA